MFYGGDQPTKATSHTDVNPRYITVKRDVLTIAVFSTCLIFISKHDD